MGKVNKRKQQRGAARQDGCRPKQVVSKGQVGSTHKAIEVVFDGSD